MYIDPTLNIYETECPICLGIGRFITNQQNIYRVTPVHHLQKAEKRKKEVQRTIQYRREEKGE